MADPGIYAPLSVLLIGIGLIELATVGTVGLILVGARWALRVLVITTAVTFIIALTRPLDALSLAGLVVSALALIWLLGPGSTGMVRQLPAASGPPAKAVVVTLLALSAPLALGLVPAVANYAAVGFALFSVVSGFLYSRTVYGGLLLLRVGMPVAALALALPMGASHALVAIIMAMLVAIYAWSSQAAVAFRPLIEKGTTYAIPPELAPREILEGARIDEQGRPI